MEKDQYDKVIDLLTEKNTLLKEQNKYFNEISEQIQINNNLLRMQTNFIKNGVEHIINFH